MYVKYTLISSIFITEFFKMFILPVINTVELCLGVIIYIKMILESFSDPLLLKNLNKNFYQFTNVQENLNLISEFEQNLKTILRSYFLGFTLSQLTKGIPR